MASMPIIPGLAGAPSGDDEEAAAPGGIAALLDAIPDDELQGLEAAAQQAAEAGELDGLLPEQGGDEEQPDEGETDVGNDSETADDDSAEVAEDDTEEDPTPHVRAAEDAAKAAAKAYDELERLVEDAKQHEKAGVDVDALEGLLEDAEKAATEAQDAGDDAHTDDVDAAKEAAATAQAGQAEVEKLLEQAKASVAKDADGAEEKAVPDNVKAMTAWATKVAGSGTGM